MTINKVLGTTTPLYSNFHFSLIGEWGCESTILFSNFECYTIIPRRKKLDAKHYEKLDNIKWRNSILNATSPSAKSLWLFNSKQFFCFINPFGDHCIYTWKQSICSLFVCWCSFYMQLWSLISASSQVQMPPLFLFSHHTHMNAFHLPFKFLNSLKNNKWIKFSKNWKILRSPITTLIAHSKMEIFHFLSKIPIFFYQKIFF